MEGRLFVLRKQGMGALSWGSRKTMEGTKGSCVPGKQPRDEKRRTLALRASEAAESMATAGYGMC
jgi:hypothetical protein